MKEDSSLSASTHHSVCHSQVPKGPWSHRFVLLQILVYLIKIPVAAKLGNNQDVH